jgi:hypothetical protein
MRRQRISWLVGVGCAVFAFACDAPADEPDAQVTTDSGAVLDAAGDQDAATGTDHATASDAAHRDSATGRDQNGGSDHATGHDSALPHDAGHPDVSAPDAGGQQGVELNPGWIGGACTGSSGCDDSTLTAPTCETTGFSDGFCTQACTRSASTGNWVCPDRTESLDTTTRCIDANGSATCVAECDFVKSPTGCRPGYTCVLRQRYSSSTVFPVCLPTTTQNWPGEATPASDVGTVCSSATDCNSLYCLPWPGGYCTKTMCEYAGCPTGSSCYSYGGRTVCLKDCAGASGCRTSEGYTCDDTIDACWLQPSDECQPIDTNVATNPFNHFVLEAINDATLFPRDGTYPFCLGGGSCGPYGFLHDGIYQAQTVFEGGGDCMCTGHTLEIFLDAWRRYRSANSLAADAQLGGLTMAQLDQGGFYQQWQGTADAQHANLASAGYAFELASAGIHIGNDSSSLETVQPGDFINLSRDPPSGHSVVFIGWIRDNTDAIIGFRYFACNPSGWDPESCASEADPANAVVAGAPSFMSEYFYDVVGSGGVIRSGIYGLQIGRAVVP